MENKTFNFYDFVTAEDGLPVVRTFQATEQIDEVGRKHLVQTSDYVLGHPYDMEEAMQALRHNGYYSWDQSVGISLDARVQNPMVALKLISLSNNSALLNKVYDDKDVVDGMHSIVTYINYVDVVTGKQYVLCVGIDNYTPELVRELQDEGYVSIENTVLMDSLANLRKDLEAVEVKPKIRER